MSDEYTCAVCGGVFVKGRPDTEALAEAEALHGPFGDEVWAGGVEVVCEDCFKRVVVQRENGVLVQQYVSTVYESLLNESPRVWRAATLRSTDDLTLDNLYGAIDAMQRPRRARMQPPHTWADVAALELRHSITTGRRPRWAHWGPDGWEQAHAAHAVSCVVLAALRGLV